MTNEEARKIVEDYIECPTYMLDTEALTTLLEENDRLERRIEHLEMLAKPTKLSDLIKECGGIG